MFSSLARSARQKYFVMYCSLRISLDLLMLSTPTAKKFVFLWQSESPDCVSSQLFKVLQQKNIWGYAIFVCSSFIHKLLMSTCLRYVIADGTGICSFCWHIWNFCAILVVFGFYWVSIHYTITSLYPLPFKYSVKF